MLIMVLERPSLSTDRFLFALAALMIWEPEIIVESTKVVYLASRKLRQLALIAQAVRSRVHFGRLAIMVRHTFVLLADFLGNTTGPGDGSSVAVVGVDTDQIRSHAVHLHILNNDIARTTIVRAVAAATVQFTGADDGVVFDGHGALAVVLNDFVHCILGTASLDKSVTGTKDRNGIYY